MRRHAPGARRAHVLNGIPAAIVLAVMAMAGAAMLASCRGKESLPVSATRGESEPRDVRPARSRAIVDILAAAGEVYWGIYRDYPCPDPDLVGVGTNTLGANAAFRTAYFDNGAWTDEAHNVALVWLLSATRNPEPLIDTKDGRWYQKIDATATGPDGRTLCKCVDGFGRVIKIDRPAQEHYQNTYLRITSAGPDGEFGSGPADPKAKDNCEVFLKR